MADLGGSNLKRRVQAPAKDTEPKEVPLMINALKKIYKDKILPFEERYQFPEFHSPSLTSVDFEAKPMVMLIGQYSVGKTTFIQYLLERDFPGVRIGPEPTTDRFTAIMHGPQDRIIPGNALCADATRPFTALNKFGMGFLNRFECSECQSRILEKISFIDTPGVLSGEKQRLNRGYDFPQMVEWFAERCDRILLLFDAHKLDISDEFKNAIESIRGHDDKVRVILNKADIPKQKLMRVYGALMWSLGKVFNTPEVLRVYVGTFWNEPLKNSDCEALLAAEERDLLADLRGLPRNAAVRRVNELIKRARMAKVHALIILHLKEQFGMFGKSKTQKKILDNIVEHFKAVSKKHNLPKGDFPNPKRFVATLEKFKIHEFKKMPAKMMQAMDEVLSTDMPKLMAMVPSSKNTPQEEVKQSGPAFNPFERGEDDEDVIGKWAVDLATKTKYDNEFQGLKQTNGKVSGGDCKHVLMASGLDKNTLRHLWNLADVDQDGSLDADEFAVAKFLIDSLQNGMITSLPENLPDRLVPPSKRHLFET